MWRAVIVGKTRQAQNVCVKNVFRNKSETTRNEVTQS
jgi:hypothetical protein